MIIHFLVYGLLLSGLGVFNNDVPSKKTYYVSATGSDSAVGTKSDPLRLIQAAVDKAGEGDTIYIRKGTYREAISIGPTKDKVVLMAYQSEQPVLKGSDVLRNWTIQGNYWKAYLPIQTQQVMVNGDHPLQQIGYPNDDFKVNQSYPRYQYPVGKGLADMRAGSFFWQNDTLYVWLNDNGDPNKQTIEVSQREYMLTVLADSVAVYGLKFRHSNTNTFQEQGAAVILGDNTLLQDCDIQWCDFGGVSMGSGSKAINCTSSNNGATGFNVSNCYDFLISHCKANNNNYRNFYAQWHAGGFKGASSAWGTIAYSEFSNNIGAGIWFDYCFARDKYRKDGPKPINIHHNLIRDNSKTANKNSALMIEVSEEANVHHNLVFHNDYRGIYISGSWNCTISNNTVAFNQGHYGIDLAGMPRNGAKLSGNRVLNNVIYNNETIYDLNVLKDNGGNITANECDYNLIHRDSGRISLKYDSVYHRMADWRKHTPFGKHNPSMGSLP